MVDALTLRRVDVEPGSPEDVAQRRAGPDAVADCARVPGDARGLLHGVHVAPAVAAALRPAAQGGRGAWGAEGRAREWWAAAVGHASRRRAKLPLSAGQKLRAPGGWS